MKNFKQNISDLDILTAVGSSNNIREVLSKIYENKNPPTYSYKRISKLMIESGVKFKNGEVYIHPSLHSLYEKNKEKKPLIKIL